MGLKLEKEVEEEEEAERRTDGVKYVDMVNGWLAGCLFGSTIGER